MLFSALHQAGAQAAFLYSQTLCLLHVWLCRTEELKRQISSLQRMITTSSVASLSDGGAKLHNRLASLRQELANLGGTGRTLFAHTNFVPLAIPLHLHTAQLLISAELMYALHTLQWLGSVCGLGCTLYYTHSGGVFALDAECLA